MLFHTLLNSQHCHDSHAEPKGESKNTLLTDDGVVCMESLTESPEKNRSAETNLQACEARAQSQCSEVRADAAQPELRRGDTAVR